MKIQHLYKIFASDYKNYDTQKFHSYMKVLDLTQNNMLTSTQKKKNKKQNKNKILASCVPYCYFLFSKLIVNLFLLLFFVCYICISYYFKTSIYSSLYFIIIIQMYSWCYCCNTIHCCMFYFKSLLLLLFLLNFICYHTHDNLMYFRSKCCVCVCVCLCGNKVHK